MSARVVLTFLEFSHGLITINCGATCHLQAHTASGNIFKHSIESQEEEKSLQRGLHDGYHVRTRPRLSG